MICKRSWNNYPISDSFAVLEGLISNSKTIFQKFYYKEDVGVLDPIQELSK